MQSAKYLDPRDWPDTSTLITEDDEPLDNIFQERQARLLVDSLYAEWTDKKFLAMANVGLFNSSVQPAIVPDVLIALGVLPLPNPNEHKSYFIWEYGKIPDLVLEIVSNRDGGEADEKLERYASMGVPYYVIYDPFLYLASKAPKAKAARQTKTAANIRIFELKVGRYIETLRSRKVEQLNLGFTTWTGTYEGVTGEYLRWTDARGQMLRTRSEVIEQLAIQNAEQQARAEKLAAKLRELGVDPES
jgi:Uma2 family endonuclease